MQRFSTRQYPDSFSEAELEWAIKRVGTFVERQGKRVALNPTKFIARGHMMLTIMDLFNPNPYDRAMQMWNLGWRGPWHRGATRLA